MITLTAVQKRFGEREVLKGVTLFAQRGSVLALVGPNGSGKTTLIKLLLGLVRADAGTVSIDALPADAAGQYRRFVGYMPQIARFPENLTPRDLLAIVTGLRAGAHTDTELLSNFRLDGEMDKPLGTLSGGTRQKVNAAIAFLFAPRLLILDEPTAGLDPIASRTLKDKIRSARAAGATVLITSHILSELEELADDVAFLCDGTLQFAGPVAELLAHTNQDDLEGAIATLMQRDREPVARRTTRTGATLSLLRTASNE